MGSKTIIIATITLLPLSAIFLVFWQTKPSNIRIPTHIWPQSYNITIQPLLEEDNADRQYTFSGDVEIRIQSVIATRNVVMHSRNLNYSSLEYWAEHTPLLKRKVGKIRFDSETERITFELSHNLNPIYRYILHFKYTGLIQDDSRGVFKKEFKDASNRTRWIVATQFEPNEARSAFPCFDEPQFKASFRISIVRPKYVNSFSNTRRICSYMQGGLFVDTFKATPIMPVYSVAFLIAPYIECTDGDFAITAISDDCNQTEFNTEVGRKILDVFSNYSNISYFEMGVDKLSIAFIPNVNFDGMENWGLVFIKLNSLLYDENLARKAKERQTTMVLAHELAHMWFGNLVTCDWWSSVWLNEGFATYFTYFGLKILEGNQSHWDELFFGKAMRHSLAIDIGDIPPLHTERKRVSREYFHTISYLKGAAIIHMARHIMGDKNFQNFIRKYLQNNKYKTVTVNNLYNVLCEYCPQHFVDYIAEFLKSFTDQASYPLITINFFSNASYFEVLQEGFAESLSQHKDSSPIYTVPISFTTDLESNFTNTSPAFFLFSKKTTHKLPVNSPTKWLIANIQGTWYYRVNYNEENWLQIGTALQAYNWSGIPVLNRAKIVDDIEHLFCIGRVSTDLALYVLKYLRTEVLYTPWNAALTYFRNILRYSELNRNETGILMRNLSDKAYNSLGFEENSSDNLPTLNNREQIVALACKYGNEDCLDKVKYYYGIREELRKLPHYLRLVVYCTTIREGNQTIYEELFRLYCNESEQDKHLILKALGCSENPVVIEKHFWNIMSPSVPLNQKQNALENLYSESDRNAFQIFKLITLNYEKVAEVLGEETTVADVITKIAKYFSKSFQKQDLINFSKMDSKIRCKKALKIVEDAIRMVNTDSKCL